MTDENNELDDELKEYLQEEDQESEELSESTGDTEEPDESKETEEESEPSKEEPSPPEEPSLVPKAALHDERRKRQEAQEELERIKKMLPAQESEEPDMYEDPEGWKKWNTNKVLEEQRTEQNNILRDKLEKSRSQILEQKSDYNQMEKIFEIMASDDPELVGKMLASENPAEFAYEKAKAYRESLLGEVKPEPKPEPSDADIRKAQAVNGVNLTNATAQDSNTPKVEQESTLDDVFDDLKY